MAQVYHTVAGKPLEQYIEGLPGVDAATGSVAFEIRALAAANLEAARAESLAIGRRFDDLAYVAMRKGRKGHYTVELNDTLSDAAANNIEFGRFPGMVKGLDAMPGLFVLTDAVEAVAIRHRRELRGRRRR